MGYHGRGGAGPGRDRSVTEVTGVIMESDGWRDTGAEWRGLLRRVWSKKSRTGERSTWDTQVWIEAL